MKNSWLGLLGIALGVLSFAVYADPPMRPFYAAVMKMVPEGKLGQVIKQEKIATSVKGAQAWKIAYVSSDISGRKTISTALVVAPVGQAPAGGRPVMTWAHGTTGSAQNCGPSQVIDPAVPLNEYFLLGWKFLDRLWNSCCWRVDSRGVCIGCNWLSGFRRRRKASI